MRAVYCYENGIIILAARSRKAPLESIVELSLHMTDSVYVLSMRSLMSVPIKAADSKTAHFCLSLPIQQLPVFIVHQYRAPLDPFG